MEFARDPLNAELFEHEQARTQEEPEEELRDQVDDLTRRSRDIGVLSFVDEGVERCPWSAFSTPRATRVGRAHQMKNVQAKKAL